MNFFGHTVLAVRRGGDPSFVLGAMLPDFATMIRARPPRPEHTDIGSGMQFHWRTDEVFHRSAAFLALTHQAVAWLSARGVRSGSALAAAHRFDGLRARLLARGAVRGDIAPETVAERLRSALADRPRLALDDAAVLAVGDWARVARASVSACAAPLVHELAAQLL